ncbi:hypothetical protein TNCV_3477651, partial [Trichonephila clavipes]
MTASLAFRISSLASSDMIHEVFFLAFCSPYTLGNASRGLLVKQLVIFIFGHAMKTKLELASPPHTQSTIPRQQKFKLDRLNVHQLPLYGRCLVAPGLEYSINEFPRLLVRGFRLDG